ncbi:putative uncharacterized protein C6orf183 [Chaetodon trifascialis]|uniref:putative uncharacterized protein C6orf183 n=1 Tax=Chaetodon trifascialis TaxID=109706 RepID=UPI003992B56E
MCDTYRASSSVKVQQMEAELSSQLSALRAEIEEKGFPQRAVPSKCYRWMFQVAGAEVAEALPVQSPADIMHRELESCLSLEYTPDSLPPLLHQDQVSYLTSEYEDAVQRARRLSASREKILTGRGSPATLLTQDDVVIYLRWLVCHLHSVQTVHNFLRVLHYLPACERNDEESQPNVCEGSLHETQHVDGLPDAVPLHTGHLEEFLPELQALIAHFQLPYDARKLRTTADEMELFSMVWREFRAIFRQQEQMRSFPQYDSTEVKQSQWGRRSASLALRKEANWIPFIQAVKPRWDPWQQKLITKLQEKKCIDELLKMHSRFLQVPDLLHVAAAIKQHGAHVGDLQHAPTASVSHSSKTNRHKISEIWTSVYGAATLTQACIIPFSSREKASQLGRRYIRSDICLVRKHTISRPYPEAEEALIGRV